MSGRKGVYVLTISSKMYRGENKTKKKRLTEITVGNKKEVDLV